MKLISTCMHFFAALLICSAPAAAQSTAGEVKLILDNASVTNKSRFTFFCMDSTAIGRPVFVSAKETRVSLTGPTFLTSAYDQALYWIYPGETINIRHDKDYKFTLSITGNKDRTEELNFFSYVAGKTGILYYGTPLQAPVKPVQDIASFDSAQTKIHKTLVERLRITEEFVAGKRIKPSFAAFADINFRAAAIRDSLALFWLSKKWLESKGMYAPLVKEKIAGVNALPFVSTSIMVMTARIATSMSLTPFFAVEPAKLEAYKEQFAFIKANFHGPLKDELLCGMMQLTYLVNVIPDKELIETFNANCGDASLRAQVNNVIQAKTMQADIRQADNLIAYNSATPVSTQALINRYKGKVIVIDFWASWCGPCRQELPFSRKLAQEYKGKDVEFIYLSTDANVNDWKNACKETGLTSGNSFVFANPAASSLLKTYKVSTIPRYMLVSKTGKVVYDNAPRPSEERLKELLDQLLL